MSDERRAPRADRRVVVLALLGAVVVAACALAVEFLGGSAIGALLGVLVVLVALGLLQQRRQARRAMVERAELARTLASVERRSIRISKDLGGLSKDVGTMSKAVKSAEIETGIAALNRYVALGTAHPLDRD
jgi:hypothetical protein